MALYFSLSPEEIAKIVNGKLIGNCEERIVRFNRIEHAQKGDITFIAEEKYSYLLEQSNFSCILLPEKLNINNIKENVSYIFVQNPYQEFLNLIHYVIKLQPEKKSEIHPTAVIGNNCKIGENVNIGAYCVIGDNVEIGDNCFIYPNVTICENVKIGYNTIIYPNVTCCSDSVIGDNCIIHPGAVIGSDGFGNIENADGSYTKIPQVGNVVIGNNVEIGANTTIDRAFIGSTIIGDGVRLDNLIHIAHNCEIGENTAMAAQVGLAGSVKVGKRNRFGGQVGIAGHLEITDDVILFAKAGVMKSIKEKGIYVGAPIRERMHFFKIEACLNKLPDMLYQFEKIKKILNKNFNIILD